jgi:predicted O-methyltransferase YrrM
MAFADTMQAMMRYLVGTEVVAAVGAQLTLEQSGATAPPAVAAALQAVIDVAEVGDLADLTPAERAQVLNQIHLYLHHARELVDAPARAEAWEYTEPAILDGWGRGSMVIPVLLAVNPELRDVTRFLDVGTGVGLLAVSAAGVWPDASIVGIDIWEPSLARARANVEEAGLGDRITLRTQNLTEVDDQDEFDCVWVPTFFMNETLIAETLPGLLRAMRPGGWIVLGRTAPPPSPLAEATFQLRLTRGGGVDVHAERAVELLENAGYTEVRVLPRQGPVPIEFVIGRKPAA